MIYKTIPAQPQLTIDQILFLQTCGYGETYEPPQPDRGGGFWELFYVKEGLAEFCTASCTYHLAKAELYFRHPSETVQVHIQEPVPSELISVGFTCTSASSDTAMQFFRDKVLTVGAPERRLLHRIAAETASFQGTAPFAAGQAALLCLQLLLIQLLRNADTDTTPLPAPRLQQLQEEKDLFLELLDYMEEHISDRLTIEQICHDKLIGRALLQKLFTEYTGCGIIDYFSLMKINAAKQLIRKGNCNFSQIAEHLGYNSIHYFSRQFKTITGATPSEYAGCLLNRKPS